MGTVVRLFDEVALMSELKSETVQLIHATTLVKAIKRLVDAHDIIALNLDIEKSFQSYNKAPPWDIPALNDLSIIRRELVVYYRQDFKPVKLVDNYSAKMGALFCSIKRREKLTA